MKYLVTLSVFALIAVRLSAQFTLDGQYRARVELRNGFKKPILEDQQPAAFVEHRARLIAGYKMEKVGFKLSLQDVRVWGETGQINKSDYLLSVHEAYGDYYATEKSTFRIGRQEIIFDGHRFFGSLDWAMQGRSLDALRYMYSDEKSNLDVFVAWNQEGFGDGAPEPAKLTGNKYTIASGGGTTRIFNLPLPKSQVAAYYKYKFGKGDISILALNDMYDANDTTKNTYSNNTIGLTPNLKFGDIKVGGELFTTVGAAGLTYNGTDFEKKKLMGYMFSAYAQHTGIFASPLVGFDYLSGDDETTSDVEGWEPKYGTNHKFYGFMDYFYVGNGHGGGNAASAGLLDVYLKTVFKVDDKTKVLAHVHYFASTAERTNATSGEKYSGTLGTEVDLVGVRTLAKGVVLKAGYSQMFGITDTMKQLKFGNPDQEIAGLQNWAWVMIAFSPKFL